MAVLEMNTTICIYEEKKELDFIFKISGLIEILATCHMNMYDLKINIHLILNKIILIKFLFLPVNCPW